MVTKIFAKNNSAIEYVASLIGLYKNNGAVSCVGINASLTFHGPWVYSDTELNMIISWVIMYSYCNTFLVKSL